MSSEETESLAEDVAYESAMSMVPGMGDEAPMAAHTMEMLEEANTEDALNPDADNTLERERALALQKGQSASPTPQPDPAPTNTPRPTAH